MIISECIRYSDVVSTILCIQSTCPVAFLKLVGILLLCLYLPLTATSFWLFRRKKRKFEVERIFRKLNIEEETIKAYQYRISPVDFLISVTYALFISFAGLSLLLLATEMRINEFATTLIGGVPFPAHGSRLVIGMAILGAYIWGIQHIFHRYSVNDLRPIVYQRLCTRIFLSAVVALVIYNAFAALSGVAIAPDESGSASDTGITAQIWPALALIIGMFPRSALNWLMDRVPIFATITNPAVRKAPLDMIEGITIHDRMRLEEEGIETYYDLADADFIPLILKTPYGARELVDWILQAKLCVHFGESVKQLREMGIRTALDLKLLDLEDVENLAPDIALTKTSLLLAKASINKDPEITRLCLVARKLGEYTECDMKCLEMCTGLRKRQ